MCLNKYKYNFNYKEAKKLIIDNRKYLDLITEALMEKETITQREIKKIFERVSVA